MEEFVEKVLPKAIEISARLSQSWAVLAKRWIVERTFAWINHFRRLSKDYEVSISAEENNIMIAHSMLLIRRLA